MTPQDYVAFVRPTCEEIEAGTGIDWFALAIQYANETSFGDAVYGYNLGNIRSSPGSFARYASFDDYAQAAIAVWHQTAYINSKYPNGFEPFRAQAAAGACTDAALTAIVASPWSGANYGGSLDSFYAPLEAYELTPDEHNWTQEAAIRSQMLVVALGVTYVPDHPELSVSQKLIDLKSELDAVKAQGVTVDQSAVLAAIADLKAVATQTTTTDVTILSIVQHLEAALKAGGSTSFPAA